VGISNLLLSVPAKNLENLSLFDKVKVMRKISGLLFVITL